MRDDSPVYALVCLLLSEPLSAILLASRRDDLYDTMVTIL